MTEGLAKHAQVPALQVTLDIRQTRALSITAFRHIAVAEPSVVKDSAGVLVFEYVFRVAKGEESVEVWRCYLRPSYVVTTDVDGQSGSTDYNNEHLASTICAQVINGILCSSLLHPSAHAT